MSSRNHTPGISQSPRDIGKRSLRGVLGQHQQRTADIRDVLYIKPLGKIQHLVRNIGTNTQAYRVGSNLPGITFRPGEIVQVASNTGHPGENIISVAPPGKKGSTPSFQGSSSLTLPTPDLQEACPTALTSASYLGVYADTSANLLYAYTYTDGDDGALVGSAFDYSAEGWDEFYFAEPVLVDENKIALRVAQKKIAVWDIVAGTATTIDRSTGLTGIRGGTAYFMGPPLAELGATGTFYWIEWVGPSGPYPNVHVWLQKWDGSVTEFTADVDAETDFNNSINYGHMLDGTNVLIAAEETILNRGYIQVPLSTGTPSDFVLDVDFLPNSSSAWSSSFSAGQPSISSRACFHFASGSSGGSVVHVGTDGRAFVDRCGVEGDQVLFSRPNSDGSQIAVYDTSTVPPTILRMSVEERTGTSGTWAGTNVSQISSLSAYPDWMIPTD